MLLVELFPGKLDQGPGQLVQVWFWADDCFHGD
jgi:hypothetical protein